MPWLRGGDNAATHPIVMRVVSLGRGSAARVLERDVAINEVFGFVVRCALQSAGHTTDYVIDEDPVLLWRLAVFCCQQQLEKAIEARAIRDHYDTIHLRARATREARKEMKR